MRTHTYEYYLQRMYSFVAKYRGTFLLRGQISLKRMREYLAHILYTL